MKKFPWRSLFQHLFFLCYLAGLSASLYAMRIDSRPAAIHQFRERLGRTAAGILPAAIQEESAHKFSFVFPNLTSPQILKHQTDSELSEILRLILPEFTNDPLKDAFSVENRQVYPAYREDIEYLPNGFPIKTYEMTGFAYKTQDGAAAVFVGVDPQARITGLYLLRHSAPQGIGEMVEQETPFFESFEGLAEKDLQPRNEGGKIPAVTGAPVLSRQIIAAVRDGIRFFNECRPAFMQEMSVILMDQYSEQREPSQEVPPQTPAAEEFALDESIP